MDPAGETTGGRAALHRASWDGDEDEGPGPVEAAEIRRALGVESSFGYHVVGKARRRVVPRAIRPARRTGAATPRRDTAARPNSATGRGETLADSPATGSAGILPAPVVGGSHLPGSAGVPPAPVVDDSRLPGSVDVLPAPSLGRGPAGSRRSQGNDGGPAGSRRSQERPSSVTTRRAAPGAMSGSAFPCLDGVRYRGCLGAACPLETCWTGGVTISYAHKQRDAARVSSALYLPGAPCHTCAELVEDEAPVSAPRATVRPGAARGTARDKARGESEPKARGESEPKARGESEPKARGESEAAGSAEPVLMRRINCARGLWEHPISLSAFLMKRIPMLDQDEPETCPGYTRRPDPHPAVAAHLQQRRERARLRRASLRVSGQEG